MKEKPSLPPDPERIKRIKKIRNLLFSLLILVVLSFSLFFFWRAFRLGKPHPTTTPSLGGEEKKTPTEPLKQTYTVQAGDTLWAIAQKFNIRVEEITKANNLKDPEKIQVGQTLIIPSPSAPATKSPEATSQPLLP